MAHPCKTLQETHTDRLLKLARQKGLLRSSDLDALGVPRVYLIRLTASSRLEKVGRGLYLASGKRALRA